MKLTKDQSLSLKRIYDRDRKVAPTFLAFRRRVHPGPGCVMIPWKTMWIGIEPDGYAHT